MGNILSKLKLGQRSRSAVLKASTWLKREQGSMNVLYAVALIPMIGALGLATDTARGYLLKARLSQSIDQAVLAGGKVFFSSTRDQDVLKYFTANFPNTATISYDTPFDAEFMDARVTLKTPVQAGKAGSETLYLQATATVPTTFMRVLNAFGCTTCDDITVTAESQVQRTIRALDAVITLDMSGSMDGSAKIGAARDGLKDFVDTVYGASNSTSPTLTVDGTTYNLINMGFLVWNSKLNVTTNGVAFTGATTQTVTSYTNPVTGATGQTTVWKANNSEVPLIMNPRDTSAGGQLPGGWSGCVYARYVGGEGTKGGANTNTPSVNNNDADLVKGAQFDVGSGATQKDWPGWEPMAIYEAEPRSSNWSNVEEPTNTRWRSDSNYRPHTCSLAYYNDFPSGSTAYSTDSNYNLDKGLITPPGTSWDTTVKVKPTDSTITSRPAWIRSAMAPADTHYSGTMRFFNDQQRPYAVPNMGQTPESSECTPCLSRGIVPLTPNKTAIKGQISSITTSEPDGNTNILTGLYWAWEVLMPGEPFNQALVTTPFQRTRYIILVTDGAQVGGNGDAFKGRFGSGENAGDNTDSAHGTISAPVESGSWKYGDPQPSFTTTNNNLDNRLRVLARNVKDQGIKLYIIGFDLADHPADLRLLASLASPPDGDDSAYFYRADTAAELKAALAKIASNLTTIRLSM